MSKKSLPESKLVNLEWLKSQPEILLKLKNADKFMMITGAGISTSSGVPDFRGANGIYKTNTMEMMNALWVYKTPENIREYLRFIGNFAALCLEKDPTPTHYFFKKLRDEGKLLRVYSQNIDNFEERVGLKVGLEQDDEVLPLHGTLGYVICKRDPSHRFPATPEIIAEFKKGDLVPCPGCEAYNEERAKTGKRALPLGWLRPNIVLYNEPDSDGEQIAKVVMADRKVPNTILMVFGTTLHVTDATNILQDLSKTVRKNGGLVILVNRDDIRADIHHLFDYRIMCDADVFSDFLRALLFSAEEMEGLCVFFFFLNFPLS